MRILIVPDIADWAIGHLAKAKVRHNPHHIFKFHPVHPRDAGQQSIQDEFAKVVKEFKPQVICFEYFRTASQLIEAKPELKEVPTVLVHHNQRDKALFHSDWNELGINLITCHTNKTREKLNAKGFLNVKTINHGIDLNFFTYTDEEPEEAMVGYVGRVCPWKGLKPICDAAKKLGYPVQMMGKQDKPDYWQTIDKDPLRFDYMDCPDEERVNAYRSMTIYVGNSEDDYEEGTLPFLEAMACGVPVVTTLNGVARDIIQDGYNGLVVDFKDDAGLEKAIERLMGDKELRATLRKNAWNTVKNMTEKKMAYEYSKTYQEVLNPNNDLVSIIVPTYNRKEELGTILEAIEEQTYSAIEVVVCDDNSNDGTEEFVKQFRDDHSQMTIKYVNTRRDGYNLAMARNMGTVEAEGRYLMFCDGRMKPEKDAVALFIDALENRGTTDTGNKVWYFGDKGAQKTAFVENFSAVERREFVLFGMMNERVDRYGGLSQDIRTRWKQQGGEFCYLEGAIAKPLIKTSIKTRRNDIIDMKLKLFKLYGGGRI